MARFDNRVSLITGAASGIGLATAKRLASEGSAVIVADVNDSAGASAVAEIVHAGGVAEFAHLDVTNAEEWTRTIGATLSRFGNLHVLVNNAGIGDGGAPIEDIALATWERVISVTQTSVFLGMRAAAEALKASGNGAVVNVSSMYGIVGSGVSPAYHAAKGAVRLLTKTTALAWANEGVRVNSVHPGFIDTPILSAGNHNRIEKTPMRRLGQPEEIAALIAFVASDDASFSTGAEFVADGGVTAG